MRPPCWPGTASGYASASSPARVAPLEWVSRRFAGAVSVKLPAPVGWAAAAAGPHAESAAPPGRHPPRAFFAAASPATPPATAAGRVYSSFAFPELAREGQQFRILAAMWRPRAASVAEQHVTLCLTLPPPWRTDHRGLFVGPWRWILVETRRQAGVQSQPASATCEGWRHRRLQRHICDAFPVLQHNAPMARGQGTAAPWLCL
jgi:hypothetical protein